MKTLSIIAALLFCFTINLPLIAQDIIISTGGEHPGIPEDAWEKLNNKCLHTKERLQNATEKYLFKLEKLEKKLANRVSAKDSPSSKQALKDVAGRYDELIARSIKVKGSAVLYSKRIDSLVTGLNFIQANNLSIITNAASLQKSVVQLNSLQQEFDKSDQIKSFVTNRIKNLKEQYQGSGATKYLKKYEKQVYYYQEQLKVYKKRFESPEKWEEKIMETLRAFPQFKSFFAHNSLIAGLFGLSVSTGSPNTSFSNMSPVQGLQTRASIDRFVQKQLGNNTNITQEIQKNVQETKGHSIGIENILAKYKSGTYGNSNGNETSKFKPNAQKTNSIFNRLIISGNIQSKKAKTYFPATSDLGLSIGYKVNDKFSVGIGASYKLGLGSGWNKIRITHQGIGVRSFVEYELNRKISLAGGYEQNYLAAFKSVEQLKEYNAWQASGLVGLSKNITASQRVKGDLKLLWDFLSYRQIPRSQPVLFRIGYNLK